MTKAEKQAVTKFQNQMKRARLGLQKRINKIARTYQRELIMHHYGDYLGYKLNKLKDSFNE